MAKNDTKKPKEKRLPEYEVSVKGQPPANLANLVSAMHSAAILERRERKHEGVLTEGDLSQDHRDHDH